MTESTRAYPHRVMDAPAVDAFLAEPRHGLLATVRADGSPQLSPVWFLPSDGDFYLGVSPTAAKARNIARDPRVALSVDAGHPDARSVTVYGSISIVDAAPADTRSLQWRLARRYLSSDGEADAYLGRAGALVLLRLVPDRILALDYNN